MPPALPCVVRQLELGVGEPHRNLLGEESRWPDAETGRNGRDYRRRGRRDRDEIGLRKGSYYGRHHDVAWGLRVIERCGYVSEHGGTGQCSGDRTPSQVALGSREQVFALSFPTEPCMQPLREVRGWLNGRKISEKQKRAADFGILLRAALAFSNVTLHTDQLDTSESIVYERDVLITKLATIHGDRLRVR
jgi:hypothetical protein